MARPVSDIASVAESPPENRTDLTWPIEPHTAAKHDLLRTYLQHWFPILGRWHRGLNYIDGFAGPGQYTGGEDGSPVLAIRTALEHLHRPQGSIWFGFIEIDKNRTEHLRSLLAERFPIQSLPEGWQYEVFTAPFDRQVNQIIDELEGKGAVPAPTLAFIDPFGFAGFPMSTVRRILSFEHCEVFVTFMTAFVNRFLEEDRANALDALFGGPTWRDAKALQGGARIKFLLNLYEEGLRAEGAGRYVRSFEIRDSNDRPLYHLVFATKHPKGLEEMKESMFKVDRRGTYRFSDLTGRGQTFLLDYTDSPDPHWLPQAAALVRHHFMGTRVSEDRIHDWVVCETPFVYRKSILRYLDDHGAIETVDGQRRRHTYPEGCMVKFSG